MKIAIAILCIVPNKIHLDFYTTFNKEHYDLYFIIDNNNYDTREIVKKYDCKFIQIEDKVVLSNNYYGINYLISKSVTSWDKAVYYFTKINKDYEYVWFLEDDVFVPDNKTIYNIDLKYPDFDLLSEGNVPNLNGKSDYWHWKHAVNQIKLPWFSSMVCAIRVSKKLLEEVENLVFKKKKLLFLEFMFNTLCNHANLKQFSPKELEFIIYRRTYKKENILETHLYHPIKNIDTQLLFRT